MINFSCFWWGHKPYVAAKGWKQPNKHGVKWFSASVRCAKCGNQLDFLRYTNYVPDDKILRDCKL